MKVENLHDKEDLIKFMVECIVLECYEWIIKRLNWCIDGLCMLIKRH